MSTLNDDAPVGLTEPTTVADTMREVADWLDAHPEITARRAFVPIEASSREDLEALAAALGDRARERLDSISGVEIDGRFGIDSDAFGQVRVFGQVSVHVLADEPVKPQYRPILPDLDAATGQGRR